MNLPVHKSITSGMISERGVTVLSTVIILPFIITIMVILFDLGRVYTVKILAKDVALAAAKFATSKSPATSEPDLNSLIRPAPGETSTTARAQFWTNLITPGSDTYIGKEIINSKEKRVFNLAYGFLYDLNSDIAFPIPDPLQSKADLNGVVNCSIYFTIENLADSTESSKSRIYYCKCAVPLIGLSLLSSLYGTDYWTVTESAYAYRSGAT